MPDHKTKVLIVDDEVFISEQLKAILQNLNYDVTAVAYNTESALKALKLNPPDIAILDIKMHGRNQGFEIANYINTHLHIPFIFLTSFADEATVKDASELEPEAYLLKPFNEQNIFSTLNVVLSKHEKKRMYIHIKIGHEAHKVNVNDILFIKSSDKYIEIQTTKKQYLKRSGIDDFLTTHNIPRLIRVHRSFAVKLEHINSVKGKKIHILKYEIPISKAYESDFKTQYQAI